MAKGGEIASSVELSVRGYLSLQRVDFPTKHFSHKPKTARGRTATTGSFIERMPYFIPDMSALTCAELLPPHSDFQVTLKLDPSDARADGTAVSALPLLPFFVEMDLCTALPKSRIPPEVEESVAESVPPLTPV